MSCQVFTKLFISVVSLLVKTKEYLKELFLLIHRTASAMVGAVPLLLEGDEDQTINRRAI